VWAEKTARLLRSGILFFGIRRWISIGNKKSTRGFENSAYFIRIIADVGPELNGFKGSYQVKLFISVG